LTKPLYVFMTANDVNPLATINLFLIITTTACVVCAIGMYQLFLLMKRTWTDPAHVLASIALLCASAVAFTDLIYFFLYGQTSCLVPWHIHAIGASVAVLFLHSTLLVILRSVFYAQFGPAVWLLGLLMLALEGMSAGWALWKFPLDDKTMPMSILSICVPQRLSLDYVPLMGLYLCFSAFGLVVIVVGVLRSRRIGETSVWIIMTQDGLWYWMLACASAFIFLPLGVIGLNGSYFHILPSTMYWSTCTKLTIEALLARWRNSSSVFGRTAKKMYAHDMSREDSLRIASGTTAPPPTPMDPPASFTVHSKSVHSGGSGVAIPYSPPEYPPPHLFSANSAPAFEFDEYSRGSACPWLNDSYPSPPSLKYYHSNTHD